MPLLILCSKLTGNDIDVYLQPSIDEFKDLRIGTDDVSRNELFHMHAALIWTINDSRYINPIGLEHERNVFMSLLYRGHML